MVEHPLVHALRGPFNFLHQDSEELRRLLPGETLPRPRPIYLENESATPLYGFPLLMSPDLKHLEVTLERYLRAEELVQVAVRKRKSFDSKKYNALWEAYRSLLMRAADNVTASNYGRDYPQIFWLFHSMAIARILKEAPKRLRRHDLAIGRESGDAIKYIVLEKYLDRVFTLLYDLVGRLSEDTQEVEDELFPTLLTAMRDNVLILTEDHISRELDELMSYFQGYLKRDGREIKERLARFRVWHRKTLAKRPQLPKALSRLVAAESELSAEDLLTRPGYLFYVSRMSSYDPKRLLSYDDVEVVESLLVKLKEFELLHGLRRLIVGVEPSRRQLVLSARDAKRIGAGTESLHLSSTTRPLDFMSPWVVNPQVSRGGLIYDITDFSATVSVLRLSDIDAQDRSFRGIFRFQRRFDQLARTQRLNWEKYLGDGAFYSGRDTRRLLIAAVEMQRFYRQAVDEGFMFNRGMRIALNFGEYRLLPFGESQDSDGERYEVFGHGVVELSRLVSGKTTREIEEIKTVLLNKGYPENTVNRFFAPLTSENLDLVNKTEESRRFYVYLNRNGSLVNEGIVATARFIEELDKLSRFKEVYPVTDEDRRYVVVVLEQEAMRLTVGLRKLGMANLKGLDRLAVYEVADGEGWDLSDVTPRPVTSLIASIDENYTSTLAG